MLSRVFRERGTPKSIPHESRGDHQAAANQGISKITLERYHAQHQAVRVNVPKRPTAPRPTPTRAPRTQPQRTMVDRRKKERAPNSPNLFLTNVESVQGEAASTQLQAHTYNLKPHSRTLPVLIAIQERLSFFSL